MVVERFLGAAFASVHGPSDPGSALVWVLDSGFQGLFAAPSPRPIDWSALRAGVAKLPFRFGGVRVSPIARADELFEAGLASTHEGEQRAAVSAVAKAVELAVSLGSGTVVLEPGPVPVAGEVEASDLGDPGVGWTAERAAALFGRRRVRHDVALLALCRGLHALCRRFDGVRFCLSLGRDVLGLGAPESLAAVFEDLARYKLGYWHDTVAAACRQEFLAEDPGAALEENSKRLEGMTLGDFGDGRCYLPPGVGSVDYSQLSAFRQPSSARFPVVIELDPGVDPGEIPGIHAFLDKFGL